MDIPAKSALLRLYTDERARNGHRALFEEIVCKARDFGVAGATVLRGPMGFGQSQTIHNASILDLSANLPLVIEMVDTEERLRSFMDTLDNLGEIGLVTLERVEVLHYGAAG